MADAGKPDFVSLQFDAMIEFAKIGVTTAILLNGGTAIAIVSFLGNLSKSPTASAGIVNLNIAVLALILLALGAVVGGAAAILAFFSRQEWFGIAYRRWKRSEAGDGAKPDEAAKPEEAAMTEEITEADALVQRAVHTTLAAYGFFAVGILLAIVSLWLPSR